MGKLKVLLKCVKTYLSRGNIEAPLDQWIEATEGDDAGNIEDVRTFLRGGADPYDDSVTISINRAVYMLATLDYLGMKTGLVHLAVQKFDGYNPQHLQIDTLYNQIIHGNKSKTIALEDLDKIIQDNYECYFLFRNVLIKEPTCNPFEGTQIYCRHR